MKKFTTLLTMAFIALMSISFTSCDDDSGATYVMDAGAKQYGFYLGDERGQDVFYGYMIGTGKAKGDVMQIDLVRYDPSGARKKTRSAATDSVAPGFGKATGRAFMPHAIKKLPRR